MAACNRSWSRELVERQCATWPAEQRERWIDLFADETSPRPWVPETAYQNAGVYTRYLAASGETWLARHGVRLYVQSLEDSNVSRRTIAGYVAALFKLGRLLQPDADLRWLSEAMKKMDRFASRTLKLRSAVVPDAVDILQEGIQLIAVARELGPETSRGRLLFRTGLFICLGINAPERLRALTTIRRDQIDYGAALLRFEPSQIKTKRHSERNLTPDLMALIREWDDVFRAAATPRHNFLWVTESGKAPCIATLYAALRQETKGMTIPLTPKLLRNAAATFIVSEAPDKAAMASILLGHTSEKMRDEYIQTANTLQASRDGARMISEAGRRARELMQRVDSD